MKKWLLALSMMSCCLAVSAQRNAGDSSLATPIFGIHYAGNFTAGDLQKRFGYMNGVGLTAGYKFRNNWYVGLDGDFLFGNSIKEGDIFASLRDSYGNITDVNGDVAVVLTFARGFRANLEIGKLIPLFNVNENSGLLIKLGGGYLNHRIRIESNDHVIPLLELDYKRGYDRLATGFCANQFIGYQFMADYGWLNFYAGFFAVEGFTSNRRALYYDQPDVPVPTDIRNDILYGFKVGWMIPVYRRVPKSYYYN